MTKLNPRIVQALERTEASCEPPPGSVDRMFAAFEARVGGPGGGEPGAGGSTGAAPASASSASSAGLGLHLAKIAAAVTGLTLGGLALLWVASAPLRREPEPRAVAPREAPTGEPVDVEALGPSAPVHASELRPETQVAPPSSAESERVRRASEPPATEPSESGSSLAAELALIAEAREAEPESSLALLERHAQIYPHSDFVSEREGLRTIAYCLLERADQARSSHTALMRTQPNPLLVERVRNSCQNILSELVTDSATAGHGPSEPLP